ncbi:unnamed protein product, partial [Rangifer tarandus platyrhynchus]
KPSLILNIINYTWCGHAPLTRCPLSCLLPEKKSTYYLMPIKGMSKAVRRCQTWVFSQLPHCSLP